MSPLATINNHYQAIIAKEPDAICAKYFPSEATYVILEGPRYATMGFEKIKKGWTDFCASPLQLLSIDWTEGPFTGATESMAWVAGIIRLKVAVKEQTFENIFRASFVLVLYEGAWTIQHEHVSLVHPDPYGMGDWLKQ
jgi:SnoaL-like domain